MGKSVIVTEKPSVAAEFKKYISPDAVKKDGYFECESFLITWCVGHLVEMAFPDAYDESLKKWTLETLPFIPDSYKYQIIANVKKQFQVIKTIYHRKDIDTIYYAGDPAREGLYIQMLVRQEAGIKSGVQEKVVWIDSQTEAEIKRGVRDAEPLLSPKYRNLAASGYARAKEDYLIGINFSRLLSILYGKMINEAAGYWGKQSKPLSVGRVMTCTLGMVVKREYEIRDFKATPFFKIQSNITFGSGQTVTAEWRMTDTSRMFQSPILYN